MNEIILLTAFMFFVLIDFKSLFKNDKYITIEEANDSEMPDDIFKALLIIIILVLFIIFNLIRIWAVIFISNSILFIFVSIYIVLNFVNVSKFIKQLEDGVIKNTYFLYFLYKIYYLAFNLVILYFLIRMIIV